MSRSNCVDSLSHSFRDSLLRFSAQCVCLCFRCVSVFYSYHFVAFHCFVFCINSYTHNGLDRKIDIYCPTVRLECRRRSPHCYCCCCRFFHSLFMLIVLSMRFWCNNQPNSQNDDLLVFRLKQWQISHHFKYFSFVLDFESFVTHWNRILFRYCPKKICVHSNTPDSSNECVTKITRIAINDWLKPKASQIACVKKHTALDTAPTTGHDRRLKCEQNEILNICVSRCRNISFISCNFIYK